MVVFDIRENKRILVTIVIIAGVIILCENKWSFTTKLQFIKHTKFGITLNFTIKEHKGDFIISTMTRYVNTTEHIPNTTTIAELSIKPSLNLSQRCGQEVNGKCVTEHFNKTLIKLFKKYSNFYNRLTVPEIPCDNYIDDDSSSKDVHLANRSNGLSNISSINLQTTNGSITDLCNNAPGMGLHCNHSLNDTEHIDIPHFIYLGSTIGRMGNQMFQMAAALGVACINGFKPIVAPTFPLAKSFDLPYVKNVTLQNMKSYVLYDPWGRFVNISLDPSFNWTLFGYFQSFKLFEKSLAVIRKSFVIKKEYLDRAYDFTKQVSKEGYENVCLHIRRGDMTSDHNKKYGYNLPDIDFVNKSMQFYINKYEFVTFIVISDDIQWCKNSIKRYVEYSPFTDIQSDIALMSLCDHVIVTAGTFGWWGAFLSGGTTVYFSNFVKNGSTLAKGYVPEDYYPSTWIGIP